MKTLFAVQVLISIVFSLITIPTYGAVREYQLVIARQEVTIKDKSSEGMTINGGIPGPTLFFERGDLARIHVKNEMSVPTSIHWHGVLVPPGMDGVPFVAQVPIQPGTTYTYEFPIRQDGTYWYHSHSELQEQRGLYGSIVIADNTHRVSPDHVILLSDWTTESPGAVMRTLRRGSEVYSLERGSSQSIIGAARLGLLGEYFKRELQRMPPMDIADVAYDYFLSNGKPEDTLEANPGEKIRLRIINGSATSYFHLNYSGGPLTIISADGQPVEPVAKDVFLIGVAETYDVLVDIPGEGAYEFRATAHDGSGFTSTWLGTGMKHPARTLPKPNLYQPIMHTGIGSIFTLTPDGAMGMSDAKVEAGAFDQPGMGGMMSDASHGSSEMNMQGHPADMDMKQTMHSSMSEEMSKMLENTMRKAGKMSPGGKDHIHSARSFGKKFALLAPDISSRTPLASEGGNERPSTPYSLLKAVKPSRLPADAPVREIRLTLDGDMRRYTWFINKKPLSESDMIRIKEGEVVRFIMINRTMMHHPMHLHGHFFRVLNGQGEYAPLKHTVDVAPMTTTVIEFYGNEVGDWFFHCHLLYHMKSGMARVVHYENFSASPDVAAVRSQLYKDPFYFYGMADILTNMTEGELNLSKSRLEFDASWEVGWQGVDDTDWEGLATGRYHLNRFTSVFGGVDVLGEDSDAEDTRGVLGLSYLLPLNLESSAWLDTDGGARFILEKEFQLTPRLALEGEVEYDTHEQWEGKVGLSYLISKEFSLLVSWHSEYNFGAGLQFRF